MLLYRLFTVLGDSRNPRSLAHRMRLRRFRLLRQMLQRLEPPWRLLDVGGSAAFWRMMNYQPPPACEIVLLNTVAQREELPVGMRSMIGDARDMACFADQSFEIVFSNSVIEHLGSWNDQTRMAAEVRRVGQRYFIQTPSYSFPVEPHFFLPGIQWLPRQLRVDVLYWIRPLYGLAAMRTRTELLEVVDGIRLLRAREVMQLFPDADLVVERFALLPKSFIAIRHSGPRA